MNFFERQNEVRRASARLVVLFIVAVLAIVTLANLLVVVASVSGGSEPGEVAMFAVLVTIGTLIFIGGVSLVRTASLRSGGGSKVARALGAMPVPHDTTDPHLRRYRNVVEEIAIASGTPVPELFVMNGERGINAFAAGYTPADAAVAVTQGALERLNRDELQGVIAHEFSHIVNGDMRLNIRLIGVLAGLTALSVIGRILVYSGGGRQRGSSNNSGAPIALIGMVALLAGFIGVFFGRLIKAAVSRQREYLADASAVQFTRQTSGLAGALKKIGGLDEGSKLRNAKTEDVSHMLFGEGMNFSSLYATHPPLIKRIQTLEPDFQPENLAELRKQWRSQPPSGLREDAQLGLVAEHDMPAGGAQQSTTRATPAPTRANAPISIDPAAVVAGIGDPNAASYTHGERIRGEIPAVFADRAHDVSAVVPLIYGLLLSADHDVRTRQHSVLLSKYGRELADAAWQAGGELQNLDPHLRLPLVEIAFPALRNREPDQIRAIMATLSDLIAADGRVSVFEYCLGTVVFSGLHEVLTHKPRWSGSGQRLHSSRAAVTPLLAVLARVGNDEPRAAEKAFRAGMNVVYPGDDVRFELPQEGILALEHVWPAVDGLNGPDKAKLIEALVTTVMDNGRVTLEEAELLRTVCAVLHCPMPPLA